MTKSAPRGGKPPDPAGRPWPGYVSTGHLPAAEHVAAAVNRAYARFRDEAGGRNADVYPALARAPAHLFGISVVDTGGRVHAVGDADHPFPIMSVSKPFVLALICQAIGAEAARERVGVNATGLPFNALEAIERGEAGRTNPMVNPGAIATTSLTPGATPEERWRFIQDGLSRFAGRPLALNDEVFACASETNFRNRAIAGLLHAYGRLSLTPEEATALYTRQCSLDVTATDLAVMGATLADGGMNPLTREQVVNIDGCRCALAVMATAGLYETSGDWLYDVGLPGKSGIGGGIVTVSPGKGGLGTFAPPIDRAGNSVKGQLVARALAAELGLNLFVSAPAV
jgi:glutaminase